jgi:hypothetical protein
MITPGPEAALSEIFIHNLPPFVYLMTPPLYLPLERIMQTAPLTGGDLDWGMGICMCPTADPFDENPTKAMKKETA